jgi:Xaa-Pro aminopeptidase
MIGAVPTSLPDPSADRPIPDHADRRRRVRELFAARNLDALVLTDLVNVRYLTGFTGSNAVLVLAADPAGDVFLTDPRYVVQSARQVPDLERVVEPALYPALGRLLTGLGAHAVGVETHVLTVDQHESLRSLIGDSAVRLVPADRPVESVRVVKDDPESADLRRACAISVAALTDLLGGVRGPLAGRSERSVAADLDDLLLAHGADGLSFDTIVAAGANSASPHHEPSEALLASGDLVVIDFGALCNGYHADMTRTVLVGGAPGGAADWQREIHGLTERANAAGRAAAVPGATVAAVDAAARELIAAGGHGAHFTHGLGHGVGLVIHEDPFLGPGRPGTLAHGTAVTIEPGVYLIGRGGVRIEDTVLVGRPPEPGSGGVREGGNGPEVLTGFSRELIEVD